MNTSWLSNFLFTHTRQTKPDGRPLYAYKMRDAVYRDLQDHFHKIFLKNQKGISVPETASIFCLYAAEAFCREHAEGSWSWETVFRPLGLETPSQQQIAEWVEKGLKQWGRHQRLLRRANGNRLFLITIACEGGLPLRLLQRENTHLTKFFRMVLEGYYRAGQGDEKQAETVARQQAGLLPPSLRQEGVFHLAAVLIAQIGELQACVGEVADPIATLDQQKPDWRRDLPLRLNDQVAETLLTGLVRRSGELACEAVSQLRWRGRLRETGHDRWIVEKRLELPESLTEQQIEQWASVKNSPRWRLLLHAPAAVEAVAWLTLTEGSGSSARYRREWLRRGGCVLSGTAVEQPHRLSLHDGQQDHSLACGNEEWGTSPWVFVERGVTGEREWLTEGSARTRAESAWVVVTPDLTPQVVNGACECVGTLPEPERTVYRISGEVDFLTAQQDRYRILCRAESESEERFLISGSTVPQALQQRPLYCGLPRIQALNREGRQQPITGRMQWRSVGNDSHWRGSHKPAQGRIWLRLIDNNDAECYRRQIDVAPHGFRIEAEIGTGHQAGIARLSGLAGAQVQISGPAGVTMDTTTEPVQLVCPFASGVLSSPLSLLLHWPDSEPITLDLPYPQSGAFFQQAGRPLPDDDRIPLDRLGGLRLMVQDPMGGQRFWLDGELNAHESRFRQGFQDRLPPLEQGRLEMNLLQWRDRIASLLASSDDLEAYVRLVIKTPQNPRIATIQVARYDALLEPDRAMGQVRIHESALAHLDTAWEARVRLEMIPLWAPAEPPVVLQTTSSQTACWDIPADLEFGPWWIIGRDGDWVRFRPLLWVSTAQENPSTEDADFSLAAAIREPDRNQREQRLNALLNELGQNPDYPDWSLLFDYVQLAREFPPSSLDVLRALPTHPHTLALALIKADDETFEGVWSLSKQMPFLWILLPVNIWREAATTYFGGLNDTLAEIEGGAEITFSLFQSFRKRASARRLYWQSLCDWLQERLFPERPLKSGELSIARRCPSILRQQIESLEQEVQGRRISGERWPESPEVMDWQHTVPNGGYAHLSPFYQPVRCAPFVAAHLSLNDDIVPNERLIYELRVLRAFDREWFDHVYAIALTLGLAQRPLES